MICTCMIKCVSSTVRDVSRVRYVMSYSQARVCTCHDKVPCSESKRGQEEPELRNRASLLPPALPPEVGLVSCVCTYGVFPVCVEVLIVCFVNLEIELSGINHY